MRNTTRFFVKDLEDPIDEGIKKEAVRVRLSDVDSIYSDNTVGLEYNENAEDPLEFNNSQSQTQSFFYDGTEKRRKKDKDEELTKDTPTLVVPEDVEKPREFKHTKQSSVPSVENNEKQNTPKQSKKQGKGKRTPKQEMKPDLPYHLTLSAEDLRRKKMDAINRAVPKGSLSGGLSGMKSDVADLIEGLIRSSLDKNKLVDYYFYMDNKAQRAAFDKYALKKEKENKPGMLDKAKDMKDGLKRDKELKQIAKAISEMDFKVPEEENLKDIQMLLNMVEKNPELDLDKMSREEKKFYEKVIVPMAEEAKEKGLDFNDVLTNKETQKQLDDLYGKHKVPEMKKDVDYEMKKSKAMKVGYGM